LDDSIFSIVGARSDDQNLIWLCDLTEGHPLKLEIAFRWSNLFQGEEKLKNLTSEKFYEDIMKQVWEQGETGKLNIGNSQVSQSVFDTFVCMALVTRRFNERFLDFLITEKIIRLEDNQKTTDIIHDLETYFFVKLLSISDEENSLHLHDEMSRLVQTYIWPNIDPTGSRKQALLKAVIKYYDQQIEEFAK